MGRARIADLLQQGPPGEKVDVRGWVRTKRESKQNFFFLEVNDGSCLANLQVVVDDGVSGYAELVKQIHTGTSLKIEGTLKESPGKEQRVELQAGAISIYGEADPQTFPLQKKRHSFEFLREIAHLRPPDEHLRGDVPRPERPLSVDSQLLSVARFPVYPDPDHYHQRL